MTVDQQVETLVFASHPRFAEEPYPPGVVAVLTREVGSYKDFIVSYRRLQVPTGSGETFLTNGEKVASRNAAVDVLLANNKQCEWLWFMDDDHKFPADILLNQLKAFYAEQFDVLGILYLTRTPPFEPVGGIFVRSADKVKLDVRRLQWPDLPGFGSILERRDLCMGTAGLLIHRRVFEKLAPPYFKVGQIAPDKEHEDLYFSIRCQEQGLKVGMQVDQCIGHTMRMTVWASRDPRGEWHVGLDADQPFVGAASLAPDNGRIVLPSRGKAPGLTLPRLEP